MATSMELAPGDARFAKLAKELDDKAPPKAAAAPPAASEDQAAASSGKPKYRHDFYNGASEVVVTVFAKSVAAEHVSVDFGEQMLSVSVEVVPAKCRYSILPSKIEVRLAKADEQVTWTSLEYTSKANNKLAATATTTTKKKVDWDKLEAEVKKEEEEEEVDTATPVVNRFFQQMYGNGDEDMRRAIMKSYVESYVLSTDWKDVGSKKIEASAPEGMELHKWEY
uniref:SGS domain-containing protein n=1 Tax=Oryza glumipatula TaxID=40148 RepID=A0A0D9Y9H3_9ORYZ